jgi:hypothetical protein
MKTIYISTIPSVEPTSLTFLPEVLPEVFPEVLPDFGEGIAGVNFSEQINIFGGGIAEAKNEFFETKCRKIAEKLDDFSVACEGKSVKNVIFIPENSYLTPEISEKISIPRKVTKHKSWIFQQKDYIYENQINIIENLLSYATANSFLSTLCSLDASIKNIETSISKEEKIALREIYNKMSGYKYQDTKKNIYNPELFVNIFYVLKKLSESKLKCYYCNENIKVLYENKRDPIQWSLERMDNKEGHNCNNVVIACLKCNLRRKTMLMQRYVETKKMVKVIKLS